MQRLERNPVEHLLLLTLTFESVAATADGPELRHLLGERERALHAVAGRTIPLTMRQRIEESEANILRALQSRLDDIRFQLSAFKGPNRLKRAYTISAASRKIDQRR